MSDSIKFKVTHGKIQLAVEMSSESTLHDLKAYLEQQTGVPSMLQKLFLKGLLKHDEAPLSSLNLRETSKILLVGSTASEISQTSNIRCAVEEEKKFEIPQDSLGQDQQRIINKGPPADSVPADVFGSAVVPDTVPGLYNHAGVNVRLTVKKDIDEIWVVNNTNTKKIPFAAIGDITFIPIIKYPGYCILTLHLGTNNKYNIYFFPQQYSRSLKTIICPFYIDGLDYLQFK